MERKLIKQGGGGFTIYLPKKWIERKKLKQGDFVKVSETESSLIIGSDVKQKESISIALTKETETDVRNILTHAYRKGFNKIIINTTRKDLLKGIKSVTSKFLLGFEVTEIHSDRYVIENISEPEGEKYDVMLKKVFLIISETNEMIHEDFEKNKLDSFEEIVEMKENCDKFVLFCKRLLTKEKYARDTTLAWELLTFLMHIEHTYFSLYEYTKNNRVKLNKEALLIKNLGDYFSLLENAYYKKDIDSIHKINSLRKDFQFGKCLDLIEKSNGKNSVVYSFIRELFRLVQIGSSPILSEIFEKEN